MRLRKKIIPAFFLSALLTTSALVSDAAAQKAAVYNPSTDWSVTRIGAGDNAYCALARRFQKNTILTLARNNFDETSFALDFQRPKFDVGQTMSVTLDPGAGQQRSFNIMPSSNNALVVRLGRDDVFFKALQKTGFLRAEIGRQSYLFNLADIDAGQARLNVCVNDVPALGYGRDAQGFQKEAYSSGGFGSMRDPASLTALEAENESLRLELAELKMQGFKGSDNYNHKAAEEIERLKEDNERLKQSFDLIRKSASSAEELRAEIVALRKQNEQLKAASFSGASANKQLGLVKALRAENEQLKLEVSKLSTPEVTPEETENFILTLEQENAALRQQISQDKARSSQQGVAETRISALRQEIEDVRKENARLRGEADVIRRNVAASYEQRLKEAQARNKKLQEALDNQEFDVSIVDDLRAQIKQLEAENKLLKETSSQATAQILRSKNLEVALLETQLNNIETSAGGGYDFEARLNVALKERDAFEKAARAQKRQISELKERLQQKPDDKILKLKLDNLVHENQGLKAEIATAMQKIAAQQSHDTNLAALQAENKALSQNIEDYKAKVSDLQDVKLELASLRQENRAMTDKLNDASVGSAVVSESLEAALAENEILKTKLHKYSQRNAQLDTLAMRIEGLEKNNQTLQAQLRSQSAAAEEKLVAAKDIIDVLSAEKDLLKRALSSEKQKNQALIAQMSVAPDVSQDLGLMAKIEQLNVENDKLVVALEKALNNASTYRLALKEDEDTSMQVADASSYIPRPEVKPAIFVADQANKTGASLSEGFNEIETAAGDNDDLDSDSDHSIDDVISEAESEIINAKQTLQDRVRRDLEAQMETVNAQSQTPASSSALESSVPTAEEILAAGVSDGQPDTDDSVVTEGDVDVVQQAASSDAVDERPSDDALMPVSKALTQAQKQELLLKQRLETARPPAAVDIADSPKPDYEEEIQISTPEGQPQSQDDLQGEPSVNVTLEEVIEEERFVAPPLSEDISINEQSGLDEVEAEAEAEAEAEVTSVPDEIEQSLEQVVQTDQTHEPRAVIEGAPTSLERDHIPEASTRGIFQPSFTVDSMLSQARIEADNVTMLEKASSSERIVHQWRADNIYGSAEQKPLQSQSDFDRYVREYLDKTQSRCRGDFAIVPDSSEQFGQSRVDSYEVACIGGGVNSSASLLFFNKQGTFAVVAHEAPAEYMGNAMALRDKLRGSISGS